MSFDAASPELVIAVVGAGTMGRGMAQIAAQAGITVLMHDGRHEGAEEARAAIANELRSLAAKGKLHADVAESAAANLVAVSRLQAVRAVRPGWGWTFSQCCADEGLDPVRSSTFPAISPSSESPAPPTSNGR